MSWIEGLNWTRLRTLLVSLNIELKNTSVSASYKTSALMVGRKVRNQVSFSFDLGQMQLLIRGWSSYGKKCLEYILCQLERISSVLMLGKMAMSVQDQDQSLSSCEFFLSIWLKRSRKLGTQWALNNNVFPGRHYYSGKNSAKLRSGTKGTILFWMFLISWTVTKKPLIVIINITLSSNVHKKIIGNWTDVANT